MTAPVGAPGLAAAWIGAVAFAVLMIQARLRRGREGAARASRTSLAGIALQGIGIAWVCAGRPAVMAGAASPAAWAQGAVVLALIGAGDLLFWSATRAMGANWSIVARTRGDHALVVTGPFAFARHPIYLALFLMLVGLAVAFGHVARLPIAAALYAAGTAVRVRIEERLLRERFGPTYDAYAARVARFVPGFRARSR